MAPPAPTPPQEDRRMDLMLEIVDTVEVLPTCHA
jgi:hypothetical protein